MISERVACESCPFNHHCPVEPLRRASHNLLAGTTQTAQLQPGELIYRPGQRARTLYVLRTGVAKHYGATAGDGEHVREFVFPGDVIGAEAVDRAQYTGYVEALDTIDLCGAPLDDLMATPGEAPRRLLHHLVHAKARGEQLAFALAKLSAWQRMAYFLGELSRRLGPAGGPHRELPLKMSRRDMANHLGLTVETISRVLTRLHSQGYLDVAHNRIVIREPRRLQELTDPADRTARGDTHSDPVSNRGGTAS